jgi:hypothetical protein
MKRQLLAAAPDPEKSRKPQRRYRVVNRDGNTDRSWIRIGRFADEVAVLLPAENLLERLQTKDVDELSVLQTWASTLANFRHSPST